MALQITNTGINLTTGIASVAGTLPNNSAGIPARFVRIAATVAAYVRLGSGAQVAVATDMLVMPNSQGLVIATLGATNVAVLQAASETTPSNEQSIATTGATSSNTINWGAVTGAVGYRIYRGTVSNTENVFYTVGAVATFLDTGAANTAGTPLASSIAPIPTPVQTAPSTSLTGGTLAAATYFYKVSAIMPFGAVQISPCEDI